jgi:hypothetical protein
VSFFTQEPGDVPATKPEALVTSVGFMRETAACLRAHRNAQLNILKLSASFELIPNAADGS